MRHEDANAVRSRLRTGLAIIGFLAVAMTAAAGFTTAAAQSGPARPEDRAIDARTRAQIVDSITAVIDSIYVFPDVAKEMNKHVRKLLKAGKYDTLVTAARFAKALTDDLRDICHDKHLGVTYLPDDYFRRFEGDSMTDEGERQMMERMRKNNFGFHKVEHLPGNIGYLDLRSFTDAEYSGPTAVAAMNFLSNSDALIVDMRNNGGGSPSLIQLITSYFFDYPVHLNSFYIRATNSTNQFWTAAYVEGKRMSKIPIFVLTSSYTFSGAEEFTYNLKNLKRATIIGETTGGGAHPVDDYLFPSLNIGVRVPFGRAINPVTGTNWEGTGVTPDIQVPQDKALLMAQKEALTKLLEQATGEDSKSVIEWTRAEMAARVEPVTVDIATLAKYVGTYGPRVITLEDGSLYYQREGRPKYKMIPMTKTLFMFDGLDYFRLEIVTDADGNPIEIRGLYDDGTVDVSPLTAKK